MTQAAATIDFSVPAMRLLEKLPEHIRAEVIYGKLYILPVPSIYHARVVSRISGELYKHVQGNDLGEVFFSPVGIYLLSGTNAVVPDIIYISKDNPLLTIDTRGVFGPTDLHIEVLSPNNKKHDLVRKKKLYEESGVREYWIIDPITKESHGYLLQEDNTYAEPLILNSKIHVRVLDIEIMF